MSKQALLFTCTACGAAHSKWNGQCDACMAWNTLVEEAPLSAGPKGPVAKGRTIPLTDLATQAEAPPRAASGMAKRSPTCGARPWGRKVCAKPGCVVSSGSEAAAVHLCWMITGTP